MDHATATFEAPSDYLGGFTDRLTIHLVDGTWLGGTSGNGGTYHVTTLYVWYAFVYDATGEPLWTAEGYTDLNSDQFALDPFVSAQVDGVTVDAGVAQFVINDVSWAATGPPGPKVAGMDGGVVPNHDRTPGRPAEIILSQVAQAQVNSGEISGSNGPDDVTFTSTNALDSVLGHAFEVYQ